MFGLFKHRHKWLTTHTNQWMIPTRQVCKKCGTSREAVSALAPKPLEYCWLYSNGSVSDPLPFGEED